MQLGFCGCANTREVGSWLLAMLRLQDPSVTAAGLLKLELEVDDTLEMPMVWLAAQALSYMWKMRCSGKVVNMQNTRAVLESKINILRETRYSNTS